MSQKKGKKLVIRVSPDINSSPPDPLVHLSSRNAKGKAKIRWKAAKDSGDFAMKSLVPDDTVFKKIKVCKKKIKCKFKPGADKEYNYTLTITVGDADYDTTDRSSPPDPRRPVIRN